MAEEVVDERDRRIAELEALVAGQAHEIDRLNRELEHREDQELRLIDVIRRTKLRDEGR